jgi:hypothetical protein
MLSNSPNYTFEDSGKTLRLVMPYKGLWLEIVFQILATLLLGTLFVGSLAGIVDSSASLISSGPLPIGIWILFSVGWLISFSVSGFDLLWNLRGYEVIEINKNYITIQHQIFGKGYARKLSAPRIDAVFLSQYKVDAISLVLFKRGLRFFDFGHGKIGVNSGKTWFGRIKTFRFGSILDDIEAKEIVAAIHKRFPHYKGQSNQKSAKRAVVK